MQPVVTTTDMGMTTGTTMLLQPKKPPQSPSPQPPTSMAQAAGMTTTMGMAIHTEQHTAPCDAFAL